MFQGMQQLAIAQCEQGHVGSIEDDTKAADGALWIMLYFEVEVQISASEQVAKELLKLKDSGGG